jgi:hypothetical protein
MSPSKPKAGAKAAAQKAAAAPMPKTKPKPKTKAEPVASAVETLRIIPAPAPPAPVKLTPAAKARSAEAIALAAAIEAALQRETEDGPALDPKALQALLAALCRVFSNHVENGPHYDIFSADNPVTATDVMVTSSALLKAANVAVFELGMWQSWTGR